MSDVRARLERLRRKLAEAERDVEMWQRIYRDLTSGSAPTPAEEREAWDRCVAAALTELSAVPSGAAEWADRMLDERRKRFGGGDSPSRSCCTDSASSYERGREQERADIVAWLREAGLIASSANADRIEAGEHLGGDDDE